MTGDLYRLHDMHPGLVSDVDPFRKQTEVLIYFLDDGIIWFHENVPNRAEKFRTLAGVSSSASCRRIVALRVLFEELKWS